MPTSGFAIAFFDIAEALELVDDGMERGVAMERRALVAQLDDGPRSCGLAERLEQSGFSDAGLAAQQHDAASAAPGFVPVLDQPRQLQASADKRGVARRARLEARRHRFRRNDPPGGDRRRQPPHGERLQRLDAEMAPDLVARRLVDQDLVRISYRLQPGRQIGRPADGVGRRDAFGDDIVDHHLAGADADPRP